MHTENLAIVTGASKGIGKALGQRLLSQMPVLFIAKDNMDALSEQLSAHPNFFSLELDLTAKDMAEQLDNWFNDNGRDFRVSYLIHNAGILEVCKLRDVTQQQLIDSFSINTFAPILINQLLINKNKFATTAKVLYITSSAARLEYGRIFAGLSLYSSTKAAMNEIALIEKREFELFDSAKNILVGRAYPGVVDTDMQSYLQKNLPDPMISELKTLPYFNSKMLRETLLPPCIIPPEIAAAFLEWTLKLTSKDYLQSPEFDIYKCEWMRINLLDELKGELKCPTQQVEKL